MVQRTDRKWLRCLLGAAACAAMLAGCGGPSSQEDDWARQLGERTRAPLAELRAAYGSLLQTYLTDAAAGFLNVKELERLIDEARAAITEARGIVTESPAPTERTQELAELLESGLGHFDEGLSLFREVTELELGSIEQFELADRSDMEIVRAQGDLLAFLFAALEIEDAGVSDDARSAIDFLAAYNRAEETYFRASAVDNEYLRVVEDSTTTIDDVVAVAREAKAALAEYRSEFAAIEAPSHPALAAAFRKQLAGVDEILESYDLAIAGFESEDQEVLLESDERRQSGFLAIGEALLELQQAFGAIVDRERND